LRRSPVQLRGVRRRLELAGPDNRYSRIGTARSPSSSRRGQHCGRGASSPSECTTGLIRVMSERRYYRCPTCRRRMLGWRSLAGIEHFVCVGPPPCGNRSRPNSTARPPLGPPKVGTRWAQVVADEVATEQAPAPRWPIAQSPPVHTQSEWGVWGWFVAAALAILLGASLLKTGPLTTSPEPTPSTQVPIPNDAPGGPQYNGYVVTCMDGWISHSGGRQGACSHHGGVRH
jgi:hypothetical protein